jgi:hypothetical protein
VVIVTADPLHDHRRVLDLLVLVVQQHVLQLRIGTRVSALLIPVDRLQLLLQADDCPVHVARLLGQEIE